MTGAEKTKLNALIAKAEKIANAKGENIFDVMTSFVNSYIFDNVDYVIDKLEKRSQSHDNR